MLRPGMQRRLRPGRHPQLRDLRQRLHGTFSREWCGDVQRRQMLGSPLVMRGRLVALRRQPGRRVRHGHHETRELRRLRRRVSRDDAPVLRIGYQLFMCEHVPGDGAALQRRMRYAIDRSEQLRRVRPHLPRGRACATDVWRRHVRIPVQRGLLQLRRHVHRHDDRFEQLRRMQQQVRRRDDLLREPVRVHDGELRGHRLLQQRDDVRAFL